MANTSCTLGDTPRHGGLDLNLAGFLYGSVWSRPFSCCFLLAIPRQRRALSELTWQALLRHSTLFCHPQERARVTERNSLPNSNLTHCARLMLVTGNTSTRWPMPPTLGSRAKADILTRLDRRQKCSTKLAVSLKKVFTSRQAGLVFDQDLQGINSGQR